VFPAGAAQAIDILPCVGLDHYQFATITI
jgi:hypothetical protein